MSNTYGGWNPQDPHRAQNPGHRRGQDANPHGQEASARDPYGQDPLPQDPQPFDPYGPRDPYGRPANPYGRPDYQPQQRPEQRDPQPGIWGQPQRQQAPAPGYQQGYQTPGQGYQTPQQGYQTPQPGYQTPQPGFPQYSDVAAAEYRPDDGEPVTVGNAWRWAWSGFGTSWGKWVVMSLLLGVAQAAVVLMFSPSALDGMLNATDPAAVDAARVAGQTLTAKGLAAAGTGICFLLQSLLYAGALAATRTRSVALRDFFALRGFGGLIGYAVITGALGFASTVVPMVGWLIQVVFTLLLLPVPFLILKGMGFGRALAGGVGLVLSHLGTALAVFAIFAGLAIASLFTCGIGLVVVAPAMLLVGAYLVQRWTGESVRG
ncbi:hypothetical protein ACFT2C_06915 [Promicromonospora sp. NPDC057138]|uniref:hypothetical protein n=1 Tax=Promicromonospora sp. NPDC057138 TaxID=3346031 RepID=UPI00362F0FEF